MDWKTLIYAGIGAGIFVGIIVTIIVLAKKDLENLSKNYECKTNC